MSDKYKERKYHEQHDNQPIAHCECTTTLTSIVIKSQTDRWIELQIVQLVRVIKQDRAITGKIFAAVVRKVQHETECEARK